MHVLNYRVGLVRQLRLEQVQQTLPFLGVVLPLLHLHLDGFAQGAELAWIDDCLNRVSMHCSLWEVQSLRLHHLIARRSKFRFNREGLLRQAVIEHHLCLLPHFNLFLAWLSLHKGLGLLSFVRNQLRLQG